MFSHQGTRRRTLVPLFAGLAIIAAASSAQAQNESHPLFNWSGRVDNEVQITMRGRNVWTRAYGQQDGHLPGPDIMGALPDRDGVVRVRMEGGQGEAYVLQQPSADNDFTTIVRIRDRSNSGEPVRVSADFIRYEASGGEVVERSDRAVGRYPGEHVVMHWAGRVDDGLEIRIRGNHVSYETLSGDNPRDVSANVAPYGLPLENGTVRVHEMEGRGNVTVVQQPNEENGFTAILRVYDPQPRAGFYNFDVTMRQP